MQKHVKESNGWVVKDGFWVGPHHPGKGAEKGVEGESDATPVYREKEEREDSFVVISSFP
jgi:hypothetical protein